MDEGQDNPLLAAEVRRRTDAEDEVERQRELLRKMGEAIDAAEDCPLKQTLNALVFQEFTRRMGIT